MSKSFINNLNQDMFVSLLGTPPDPIDNRDFDLSFSSTTPIIKTKSSKIELSPLHVSVPKAYDIRDKLPEIRDQGPTPYCTAYAVSAGLSYYNLQDVGKHMHFSEKWLYNKARAISKVKGSSGAYIRSALKVANLIGTLPNKEWSYFSDKAKITGCKLNTLLDNYKISSYARINPKSVLSVKNAIMDFGPIYAGFYIFDDWRYVGRDGVIPDPSSDSTRLGGHAVLIVGWDDSKSVFTIRNSWGDFGDDGYGYITYNYFDRFCHTCWSAIDIMGSKDLYTPTVWEKIRKKVPRELKKAFGIPF